MTLPHDRIGAYRLTREIGQGGMGVVYAAHDERLDRPVAIKVVRPDAVGDPTSRVRFAQEARAAARVSHPHICPLYELGEHQGQPFLVMELLEGESLAERLKRGALPVDEALEFADQMLDAMSALHRRGIIHRDLKPANVFLSAHGVKLLDFGLARPVAADQATRDGVTARGVIIGTPQYMCAEQLFGRPADERADVWAAAAVIYEMLAGRPAFAGSTLAEIIHAVCYQTPPPLGSSPDLRAIDQALRPAFAPNPVEGHSRIDALASSLRRASAGDAMPGPMPALARPAKATRFLALPLRVLRSDPETDFLAFSVPDAVSSALSSIESVVIRTRRDTPLANADVRAIAREADVDVVLTGTLMRAGDHVRVSAQLTDAADGTLLWSEVAQAPLTDLFQLQDALTGRIVSSLRLPLTAGDRRALERQAPASAEAYALFMRANQLMTDPVQWHEARALYERAVDIDPAYAPAWAALGRARRVLAKWGGATARDLLPLAQVAFSRAMELDAESSMAHDLAAYVDCELGLAPQAMDRLLRRARSRPADAALMAGLVTTCRYAGLLEASLAAYARAASIDPSARTSVCWTLFLLGRFDEAIAVDLGSPPFCALQSRFMTGRLGIEEIRELERRTAESTTRLGVRIYRHLVEGSIHEAAADLEALRASGFDDPEGWYLYGAQCARAGAGELAVSLVTRAVRAGYACHVPLLGAAEWAPLRAIGALDAAIAGARDLVARARDTYERAGGAGILGPLAAGDSQAG